MSKHQEIADLLIPHFDKIPDNLSNEEIYRFVYQMFFLNFRIQNGKPRGLYLTHTGFELLSKYAKSYEISMPEDYKISMTDKLVLDNMCIFPYYYKVSEQGITLYLFEEELATTLKLNDGNIVQAQHILYGAKKFLK